jgi:phosphoenolpyruvate-protein kinase (PTS system EI component)
VTERELLGLPAAAGVAVGRAFVLSEYGPDANGNGGAEEQRRAAEVLAQLADELSRTADRLRGEGREEEAEILEANRLMAEDPSLGEEVERLASEMSGAAAVVQATERHALQLEGIPDAMLSARAADVRRLGHRAARLLAGAPAVAVPPSGAVVVARDLGPADMTELDLAGGSVLGLALAEGGATSHAAIIARAFGVPMVVGLGDVILSAAQGEHLILDGDAGTAVLAPGEAKLEWALGRVRAHRRARLDLAAGRTLPAVTQDGRAVRLLCNASTPVEVEAGLAAGAEGVGLLRTELAFLEAAGWPTEAEHVAALTPTLAPLAGRVATVRTLDFGADKTPPFLAGIAERGVSLSLAHPDAFAAQLRAILTAGAGTRLRIMLPLVQDAPQLRTARELLNRCVAEVGWPDRLLELGAMIETPEAAERSAEIAAEADFLSIGTNDLVQYVLGLSRERPTATVRSAADPEVLSYIARTIEAAHARDLAVEVCGEAAGEPLLGVLLVGLGVNELSVAPARLDELRATIRRISAAAAARAARGALATDSARQALALAAEVASAETGDERGEMVDGRGGVVA